MALSPVIVGGDCGQLILVWRWWMALGWPLLMVSFFWCVKQPKVVYFVEFYAFRVLRAFVVFYQ
ncbi:hypothetical protein [Bartonella sp. CE47NXGY]|uniref:hypothetical protein n=1 Tax=Bartonella sp. CE47NXGY TaxID=3243514 RepID=UPI0035CEF3A9